MHLAMNADQPTNLDLPADWLAHLAVLPAVSLLACACILRQQLLSRQQQHSPHSVQPQGAQLLLQAAAIRHQQLLRTALAHQ